MDLFLQIILLQIKNEKDRKPLQVIHILNRND